MFANHVNGMLINIFTLGRNFIKLLLLAFCPDLVRTLLQPSQLFLIRPNEKRRLFFQYVILDPISPRRAHLLFSFLQSQVLKIAETEQDPYNSNKYLLFLSFLSLVQDPLTMLNKWPYMF